MQDAQLFQMQGLCALKSQGEEGRVPLLLCPSPGLSLSCPHKKLSPADHFLCDSFQASQLCLSLAVFLCPQPTGCFCSTSSRASIPALTVGWKGFVCVCVCVCFLLFYFLFCLCFCCCCCCCSIYTFQTCHAGPPLPPTAVRSPYKETVRANKKQTMYREISKCIQRNVLLQRQYRGPPGAHYCSR